MVWCGVDFHLPILNALSTAAHSFLCVSYHHRGFADAILWFSIHNFGKTHISRSKALGGGSRNTEVSGNTLDIPLFRRSDSSDNISSTFGRDSNMPLDYNAAEDPMDSFSTSISVEENFGIDIDLSPQLNLALREEVYLCTYRAKALYKLYY